jgi:Na+-transporting NADH:ubiquinone oxidoreductase subunit NqrD
MSVMDTLWSPMARRTLFTPLLVNNPIAVQVLGICSALAVTTRVDKAIVMGVGVTLVAALANLAVSLVRNYTPNSIRNSSRPTCTSFRSSCRCSSASSSPTAS